MPQLTPETIVRAARALFQTAHSDILILLALKAQGASVENGVSHAVTVSSTSAVTPPLRYLCWINDSFEAFVASAISNNKFDNNQPPLPSRPMGNSAEDYALYFPISDNARYIVRKSDSNRGVIWTRGADKWKNDNRYGIKPHESIVEIVTKEQGQGASIRLRPDYVYSASSYFAPDEGKSCSIPWRAFVIWCCRNEVWDDIPSFADMEREVTQRLHLSEEEIYVLFTPSSEDLTLSGANFEDHRDETAYNTMLCFGEPQLPANIVIHGARTVQQLKFESQLSTFAVEAFPS